MYNAYLKNEKDEYIVFDEKNNFFLINCKTDIEEILNLENNLELIEKEINNNKEKLNNIEQDKTAKDFFRITSYLFELMLGFSLFYSTPMYIFLIVILSLIIVHNIISVKIFDTEKEYNLKKENIKKTIQKELIIKDNLIKKLDLQKTKYEYKERNLENKIETYAYINSNKNIKKLSLRKSKLN